MECETLTQMNVRVPASMETEIRDDAKRHFGNNASALLRFYTRLGLEMRRQLGPDFERVVVGYIGREALEKVKVAQ